MQEFYAAPGVSGRQMASAAQNLNEEQGTTHVEHSTSVSSRLTQGERAPGPHTPRSVEQAQTPSKGAPARHRTR